MIKNKNGGNKNRRIANKLIIIFLILIIVIIIKIFNIESIFLINKNYRRIFLCTLYNNEAEMAYIHLWRLYDYIDRFIIMTSNVTYTGIIKNITFKPFEDKINKYMNKIDIVFFNNICNYTEYPNLNKIWCIEYSQRDYAKTFIENNYKPDRLDLLIVVDIDEILTKEGIEYIKNNPPNNYYFIKGSIEFPYYYHHLEYCDKSVVVRYNKNMKTLTKYRQMKITNRKTLKFDYNPSKPLITHCSYCFKNIDEYKNKLKSYSHQEFNIFPYNTNDWIFKSHYCRIKINSPIVDHDMPYEGWKHLIPNDERLKYLIDPSFIYDINQTNYTTKDLENLCNISYNRTPFEISLKYKQ